MRIIIALLLVVLTNWVSAEETVIEALKEPEKATNPGGTLGTASYTPTEKEAVFFHKLSKGEHVNGSMIENGEHDYKILGKKDKQVAWFGIVREIKKSKDNEEYELLVEHKYFDGLTDLHILALSFNGSGDFKAKVRAKDLALKPLMLIRCYGKVVDELENVPVVDAGYLRIFPWKTFTFLAAYGTDRTNAEWKKKNKVNIDDIYDPIPNDQYYLDRLGEPKNAEK